MHVSSRPSRIQNRQRGRRTILSAALCLSGAALIGAFSGQVSAAAYPDKPIILVVPYSAGGPTDVVARLLAVPMGQSLGQNVLVENTVGAGGTIAPTRVARAKNDGYTILIHHMGMATAPALYKKLPYDPLKDFEYIGQVLDVPMTLLSRKDFPVNTFPELLAYVKKNQDKVTMAHAGTGAVSQLCSLLFMHQVGVKLTTVPYKGAGPAMNDLMGGQVDLLCDQTTQTVPVIQDGKRAKVFGVTTPKRLSSLPNIPTLDEQGLKGFDVKVWHGMYAPKGTPKEVIDKLNKALNAALVDDNVKKRIAELSADLVTPDKATPESLHKHLESEVARWGKVIREAGITAE